MREMKDSGVEWIREIPQEWKLGRIKHNYAVTLGKMVNKNNQNKGDSYMCAANLRWNGVNTDVHRMMDFTKAEKEQYLLTYGDILITEGGSAGTACIYRGEFAPCYFQNSVNRCRGIHNNKNKFLYYWMNCVTNSGYVSVTCNQATIMHYTKDKLANTPFPILSPAEQSAIVSYLDRRCAAIDRTIKATQESIEKLKEYKSALITKCVTKGLNPDTEMKDSGVDWIGEIPAHWQFIRTKYLFEIMKRIAGTEGYDVLAITQQGIKVKDLSSNKGQLSLDYSKYQLVYPGDFAMNHMDLLTGWMDLSDKAGVTSPDYRVFRKCSPLVYDKYYRYVFQNLYTTKVYYGLAQGVAEVGRKRLQAPAFLDFKLPVPLVDEQKAIVAYLDSERKSIDNLIAKKEQLITKFTEYRKSLIYHVVTGKIDCREEETA